MKDAISGVLLFQIVILFILLFTGIMSLTINRSKAFAVKNDVINIIEKNEGTNLSDISLSDDLVKAMTDDAYRTVGKCSNDDYVGYDREGKRDNVHPSICIKKIVVSNDSNLSSDMFIDAENEKGCYYQVLVFYKLDFPLINQIFNFSLLGETKVLYGDYC